MQTSGRGPHKQTALATILRALSEHPEGLTKVRMAALVGSSEKSIEHYLDDLRNALGYPIAYDEDTQAYRFDESRMISCSLANDDLRLLHAAAADAIAAGSEGVAAVLRNAVMKLQASTELPARSAGIFGRTPPDEVLVRISSAIEQHQTLRLAYQGTRNREAVLRDFAPSFVFETARSYYASGLAANASGKGGEDSALSLDNLEGPSESDLEALDEGISAWAPEASPVPQWRTLKLSRIDADSIRLSPRAFTQGADAEEGREKAENFFFVHNLRLALRPECAGALRQAMEADSCRDGAPEGWDCVRIDRIDRSFLIERLMTYGMDVMVLSPPEFRDEWVGILRHVGGL